MSSHSLVASPNTVGLPIAQMRSVFNVSEVERKLDHLHSSGAEKEHEILVSVYKRMLERGPERFAVKPSGVPDMDPLYDLLPNFCEVLDDIKRHVALSQDSADSLEITPILLLGPPGVGKTHFARQIADMLGTSMSLVPMSSMTAGWLLSGSSSQWKGSKPGKVFEALIDGQYANPVVVVDEIDKASANAQYDPLGSLYGLLEHDTSQRFVDEFADVAIDASQVIWITTANHESSIPEPILNRMNVFEIKPPSSEAARKIAAHLHRSIRTEHDWGQRFEPEPTDELLDALATLAPRDMRRALVTAFGNARLSSRYCLEAQDLPRPSNGKSRIGFLQ